MRTFRLPAREDTLTFGRALGRRLQPGDVVALIGDLGAGKTTLTQGIAQGLEITEPVTSPTFTLVQEYRGRVSLFHFDPYRLERPEDAYGFGFEEYLERDGVVVIEWADRIAALLPPARLTLTIREAESEGAGAWESGDEEDVARQIVIEAQGRRYAQLVTELVLTLNGSNG